MPILTNNTYFRCPRHGGRVQCGIQDCQYTANCVRYHREENECCGRCAQVGCMHSDGKVPQSCIYSHNENLCLPG